MSAPVTIAGWGLLMAVIGAVGVLFFGFDGPESPALFGGVALAMVALGAGLRLTGLGSAGRPPAETVADVSPATVWLALALVLLATSAELGFWLTLIAAGMAGAGVAGLVAERTKRHEAPLPSRPPAGRAP